MKVVDSNGYKDWERVAVIKVDMYIWECYLSPYYKGWNNEWGGVDYSKLITEIRLESNLQTKR